MIATTEPGLPTPAVLTHLTSPSMVPLAQSAERRSVDPEVTGSIPVRHPPAMLMDMGKTTPGEGFPLGVVAF